MRMIYLLVMLIATLAWSAPARSADAYFKDAAHQFIEGRLPTATLTCEEGLRQHPNNPKLQMLLERIKENQEEQKKQCNNPQDDDSADNKDKEKENDKDQENKSDQDQKDSDKSGSSSSNTEQNPEGKSSSSGSNPPESEPEAGQSSNSGSSSASAPPSLQPGELSREQAEQLLRDFNQNKGERKPWKPVPGRSRPEKDW